MPALPEGSEYHKDTAQKATQELNALKLLEKCLNSKVLEQRIKEV